MPQPLQAPRPRTARRGNRAPGPIAPDSEADFLARRRGVGTRQGRKRFGLDAAVIYAGIIGLGYKIGIRKMARISPPLSKAELENAINCYFSLDNDDAANDRV